MPKLIRVTTIPQSFRTLLTGQLKFMKDQGFDVIGVSSPGSVLLEVQQNEGVKMEGIPLSRKISPLNDLVALINLYKLFKKEKPNIVHTHTPKAGLLGMMAAKISGVPHRLHTVAGMPLMVKTGLKRKILELMEVITYKCATRVYPNSYGLYEFILKSNFVSKDKLKVIGNGSSNGIDLDFFNPDLYNQDFKHEFKKSLGLEPDDFVFLFVGRLVRDKGINELISSFLEVKKKKPKVKLLLVGAFEKDLDPLESKTEFEIFNNEDILYVGHQKDVRPYFLISNVFVFPSYREGFPNVLLQACAMEIPSIATNINGCNEIIQDGKNGFLVEIYNCDELVKKMLYLVSEPIILKELKDNSRGLLYGRFERKYIQNLIYEEYSLLLKNQENSN